MINLIPPAAKQNLKREYMFRVATVWLWLLTFAVLVGIAFAVPVVMLINLQQSALTNDSSSASQMKESLAEAEAAIKETNVLARHLSEHEAADKYLTYIDTLDEIAPAGIRLTEYNISHNSEGVPTIAVSGVAASRASLSKLVDAIEANPDFTAAKLPIDSLAATTNINFNLNITPSK